jgi:hypothetical protein
MNTSSLKKYIFFLNKKIPFRRSSQAQVGANLCFCKHAEIYDPRSVREKTFARKFLVLQYTVLYVYKLLWPLVTY